MQKRFRALSDGAPAPVTFGTFHGIYYGILSGPTALPLPTSSRRRESGT